MIVHTRRAQEQIRLIYHYDKVDVHPLKMVPEHFQPSELLAKKIRSQLELQETDVLIGLFGYISAYKGHLDAIKAMKYLPDHYKLLVFGRQHPQTLSPTAKVDPYIGALIKLIDTKSYLHNRVFFIGELSNEDFLHMAASVDIAWLPYYENGQDGSGIASICMDVCKRVLCSTSFAFDELFKLIPYRNYLRFDVGNILEIANKTKMIFKEDVMNLPEQAQGQYTIKSQVDTYVSEVKG